MKIAVIGSNGYLGKHIARFYAEKKADVYGFSRAENRNAFISNYQSVDLSKPAEINAIDFSTYDYIFFFASLTGTLNAYDEAEKYIQINEIGLVTLLNQLRTRNFKGRIIFPSSRLVYKGQKNIALKEEDEKEFKTIYALNKWTGEQLLHQYHNYFGLNFTIFRICVPFGNLFDKAFSYGTIGFMMNCLKQGKNISLFGDGSLKRTFTHVSDICESMDACLKNQQSLNQVFNVGGETLSLLEAAKILTEKSSQGIDFVPFPEIHQKLESGDTIFNDEKMSKLIEKRDSISLRHWVNSL